MSSVIRGTVDDEHGAKYNASEASYTTSYIRERSGNRPEMQSQHTLAKQGPLSRDAEFYLSLIGVDEDDLWRHLHPRDFKSCGRRNDPKPPERSQ